MTTGPALLQHLEASIEYGSGLQRRGLGYALASEPGELPPWEVSVSRLRVSGGELRGQLRVLVDRRHLSAGTFNLSSISGRAATARLLTARQPKLAWPDILERFCVAVIAADGAGEPSQMIGRRRESTADRLLLPPLLPAGHASVLFGPGGAGKSTLAAAVAVSVATGSEVVPGWKPSAAAPVVLLDWEATADDWTNLLASVAEGAGLEPAKVAYFPGRRPLADDVERIAELVAGLGAGLVIVDSVGLALGAGREAADPADAVLRLHQALRHLRTTSLLIDHVTGADISQGANGTSRPYGSIYKSNSARDVWELRREQEPRDGVAEVLLVHAKANLSAKHPPIGLRVIHQGDTVRFERGEVTASELEARLSIAQRMRRCLAQGALTSRALAGELSVPEPSVRSALQRHPGLFTRLEDGRIGLLQP